MTSIIQASGWNKAGIWSDRGGFSWEPRLVESQPTLCCCWLLFPHKYNTSLSMRVFSNIYHSAGLGQSTASGRVTPELQNICCLASQFIKKPLSRSVGFQWHYQFHAHGLGLLLLRRADTKSWAYLQEHILSAGGPSGNPTSKAIQLGSAAQAPMGSAIKHTSALHIRTDTKAQSAKSSFHHGDWLHLTCN